MLVGERAGVLCLGFCVLVGLVLKCGVCAGVLVGCVGFWMVRWVLSGWLVDVVEFGGNEM